MPGTDFPPTPMEAAAASLTENAKEQAGNYVMRRVRTELKKVLPRFLWPLIPGGSGTVTGEIKKAISKRFWSMVGGCVFSIFFFSVVGSILAATALYVVYAIMTS